MDHITNLIRYSTNYNIGCNYRIDLAVGTKQEWANKVLSDFDTFFKDHAYGERKYPVTALGLAAKDFGPGQPCHIEKVLKEHGQ